MRPRYSTLLYTCKRSALAFSVLMLLALAPLAQSHVDPVHLHLDDSANHCELCLNQAVLVGVTETSAFQALPAGYILASNYHQHYAQRPVLLSPIRGPPSLFISYQAQ